jgi:hypothetical protein
MISTAFRMCTLTSAQLMTMHGLRPTVDGWDIEDVPVSHNENQHLRKVTPRLKILVKKQRIQSVTDITFKVDIAAKGFFADTGIAYVQGVGNCLVKQVPKSKADTVYYLS